MNILSKLKSEDVDWGFLSKIGKAIGEREAERKTQLENLQLNQEHELRQAQLKQEIDLKRLEHEKWHKEAELENTKKIAEMEQERLNRILADANATSEQIVEQQRLAAEAEEKATKEAERIAEDHRKKMEDFEVKRASEHAEIRQRYETRSQEMRAEAERDRELMERNRQEQIRLHKEIEEQTQKRHELEIKLLNELMENKQIKRVEMSAELKAEIEEAKRETEKRYKEELDALKTQKQKEAEWYKEVMQQLNAESEQLDANHRERMKCAMLFDSHMQLVTQQTKIMGELCQIANQQVPNSNFNNIMSKNAEELMKIQDLSVKFHHKINILSQTKANMKSNSLEAQNAQFAKDQLKNKLELWTEEANHNYNKISHLKLEEEDVQKKAIQILDDTANIYRKILEVVMDFEIKGAQTSQVDDLKKLEDEARALSRDLPRARNVYEAVGSHALQEVRQSFALASSAQNLSIESGNNSAAKSNEISK
ncbi:hypothetical protein WR25_13041 [Diploscapter pachys]|uniref:Uncharacterized protein n=1 Tax=Diploscapter pachys TaxID=2018661 RepID=A0A2A2JUN8_9BILA|nr:hypothetical protein WR25_13041 [Diploscapter pachys]